MRAGFLAAALLSGATAAMAAPETFRLDPSHSQVLFSYDHLGYSTTWGMFSGFEGDILFDRDAPEQSSVSVSIPVRSMFTGWQERFDTFMSADFLDAESNGLVTFMSTGIEVTGAETARITGALTLNGVTRSVVLDARLNQVGTHPMENRLWAGFDAETTLKRSDFGLGQFAPFISDAVEIRISVEAFKAE